MQRFLLATAASAAVLSGCSWFSDSSSGDYKSAGKLPPLEVPPDLTSPQRDNRYAVPETARSSATLSGYEAERREPGRAARGARRGSGAAGGRAHEGRARRFPALAGGAGAAREALAADQGVLAGERLPRQDGSAGSRRDGDRLGREPRPGVGRGGARPADQGPGHLLLERRARQVPHPARPHSPTARAPRSTSAIAACRRSTTTRDPVSGAPGDRGGSRVPPIPSSKPNSCAG